MSARPSLADLNSFVAAKNALKQREGPPIVGQFCIALAKGLGMIGPAQRIAREDFPDTADILRRSFEYQQRTAVDPGSTPGAGDWGNQLTDAAGLVSDVFLDLVRPLSILGRIPGIRRVPFNVIVPTQTAGMSFQWIAEGVGKPVGKLTVSNSTILWSKISGIIVTTRDLIFASPITSRMVQNDLIKGSATFLDQHLISTIAGIDYICPPGLLTGVAPTGGASGTTADAFRADMKALISAINLDNPAELVVLMSTTDALNLSLMGNEFPELKATGGFIGGLPVIASESVGDKLILLHAPSLLLAEGAVEISFSDQATIELDDVPSQGLDSPPSTMTNVKSFYQNDLRGFRVTRYVNWKLGKSGAIKYIIGTNYGG